MRLAQIDEVVGGRLRFGEGFQVGEQRLHGLQVYTLEERRGGLTGCALRNVEPDQPLERLGHPPRGYLRGDAAELRALFARASADQHEVLRHRPGAELAHAALKTDAGDVVLAA